MGRSKESAIKIVVECAEKYETELSGKSLLLFCVDKHKRISTFELSFHSWNYLHLTGLRVKATDGVPLTPQRFYERCLAHKLSPNDFDFSEDGTTELKLDVLPYIICKNLMANSIGDFNRQTPRLVTEKLAGGQKACIGFTMSEIDEAYVPNTLLKGDIRDFTKNNLRIVAMFRKSFSDAEYQEITYLAKKVDWETLAFPTAHEALKQQIIDILRDTGRSG